ncbi:hypothetical protein CspeluHIS016_0206850 [Cutaneotrichosporon spelunceum]|uniref:Guanine nucleotide-binding protein subunit gamma n=1 Tax=Cutaneotrichosporon spelunceum TaxID=1672016 RepID=A0AAD3YBC1_9TREE|nr:hypothetical protein CspeluHIS016_0206850 [Cutaneotrichosporon spelunceum]
MPTNLQPEEVPRRHNKNSMHELKLRRILENNARLKEDLSRPRIPVSQASLGLIRYCQDTRDPILPSVWGEPKRGEDPYAPPETGCGCTIM